MSTMGSSARVEQHLERRLRPRRGARRGSRGRSSCAVTLEPAFGGRLRSGAAGGRAILVSFGPLSWLVRRRPRASIDRTPRSPKANVRAHVHAQARRHHARLARHRRRGRDPRPPRRPRSRPCCAASTSRSARRTSTPATTSSSSTRRSSRSTRKKATDKLYHRHSGYPGGIRSESLEHLLAPRPRAGRAARGAAHAAEGPARSADVEEAEGLRAGRRTRTRRSSPSTRPLPARSDARSV